MAAKKKNVTDYDSLRQRTQDRDVYMEQQVGRSRIHGEVLKETEADFCCGNRSCSFFLATYFGVGLIQLGYYACESSCFNADTGIDVFQRPFIVFCLV